MKFAVLAMIFVVLVVVSAEKRCSYGEDCEEGECCVAKGLLGFKKGKCKPLADDGEECNDEDAGVFGRFSMHCPCKSGLSCVPERMKDLGIFGKIKINERCTSEPISTEAPVEETEPPVEETEEPAEE